jgi:hypothetical protein
MTPQWQAQLKIGIKGGQLLIIPDISSNWDLAPVFRQSTRWT